MDNYRKNSKQAWALLKQHIDEQTVKLGRVCFELVFPELDNILLDYANPDIDYKFIRVDVSLETSLSRVESRGLNSNFPKSREFVKQTYNRFYSQQYKDFAFDLTLSNQGTREEDLLEKLKQTL